MTQLDQRALKKALDLVETWTPALGVNLNRDRAASEIRRIASIAEQEFAVKDEEADLPGARLAKVRGVVNDAMNAEKALRKFSQTLHGLDDDTREALYGGPLSPTDKFGNPDQLLNPDDYDHDLAAVQAIHARLDKVRKAVQPYYYRYRKGGPLHNKAGAPVHMPAQGLIADCIDLLRVLGLADVMNDRSKRRLRAFVLAVAEVAGVGVSARQLRSENIERTLRAIDGQET